MSTEIQENISPDKTDQITETKSTSAKAITSAKTTTNKIKDPRKVAAGLKLTEKNKIAREALKKQKQRDEEEEKEKYTSSWLPNTSFTTILFVVGIGLIIFDLYLRTRQNQSPKTLQSPRTENEIPKVANKTQTQSQMQSQAQIKRFGME